MACCCLNQNISIEFDYDSPDAPLAEARLRDLANVELRFGNARTLLPEIVKPHDVVVIDGPKYFGALKLALPLPQTGRPRLVFIHDCHISSPIRGFIEQEYPSAVVSDHPKFTECYRYLDERCADAVDGALTGGIWRPYEFLGKPHSSYGPTFAYLTPIDDYPYKAKISKLSLEKFRDRVVRSVCKRFLGGVRD